MAVNERVFHVALRSLVKGVTACFRIKLFEPVRTVAVRLLAVRRGAHPASSRCRIQCGSLVLAVPAVEGI